MDRELVIGNFAQTVDNLKEDDIVKIILKKVTPQTENFKDYWDRRIRKEQKASKVILMSLFSAGRDLSNELFDLDELDMEMKNVRGTSKNYNRAKVFNQLLKEEKIKTKLPKENLLQFVAQYSEYVSEWRNKFSHAVSEGSDKEKNMSITQAILDSIALIDVKK